MVTAGWGRIVNIASSSAQTGSVLQAHYSASKGAVIAFTRSLARELGSKGITVNAVPPSFIDTPSLQQAEESGFLGSGVEVLLQSMPIRRVVNQKTLLLRLPTCAATTPASSPANYSVSTAVGS